MNARDKHLGSGQRWIDVALRLQSTVQVLNHDMVALSNNLVAEINMAIGDIPSVNLLEVLKILRKCFTSNDIPW